MARRARRRRRAILAILTLDPKTMGKGPSSTTPPPAALPPADERRARAIKMKPAKIRSMASEANSTAVKLTPR